MSISNMINMNSMNIKCVYLVFFAIAIFIFVNVIQKDVLSNIEGLINGRTDAENQEIATANNRMNQLPKSTLFDPTINKVPSGTNTYISQYVDMSYGGDDILPDISYTAAETQYNSEFAERLDASSNARNNLLAENAPWTRNKDGIFKTPESCPSMSNLPMNILQQNAWCWSGSTNMNNCDISYLSADCSAIYLPTDPSGLAVYIASKRQNPSGTRATGTGSTTATPSTTFSNPDLQAALDNLENKFIDRINVISTRIEDRNKLMFPTLNTSYLDIKNISNSEYIYSGNKNDGSTPDINGYSCYPSLTGDFESCGPSPYQSPINI